MYSAHFFWWIVSLEKRVDDIGQGDALRIGGEVKARPERRPKRLEDTVISEVEERTADNKPGQILETSCVGVEHNQDEEEKVRRLRNRQQELDESLEDPRRCATYIVYSAEDLATDSTLHADTQQAALKREKEQVTLTKDASRATHDHEATEESDHWKPPHLRLKNGHRAQLGEDSPGAADGQGFDVAVNMMNSSEDAESKGIMRKSRRLRSCRQDTPGTFMKIYHFSGGILPQMSDIASECFRFLKPLLNTHHSRLNRQVPRCRGKHLWNLGIGILLRGQALRKWVRCEFRYRFGNGVRNVRFAIGHENSLRIQVSLAEIADRAFNTQVGLVNNHILN
jgi:hypothetical protein